MASDTSSSSAPQQATAAVLKLHVRGETFRLSLPSSELSWPSVSAKVNECLAASTPRPPTNWALVYTDNEGDLVTVYGADEFHEALRVFSELAAAHSKLQLTFHVVAKTSFREQLAPVLQFIDDISQKMARVASETRESLRRSAYVERGRESLYSSAVFTRSSLFAAGRGVSQRVQRASVVVAEELSSLSRRVRTRSRFSSHDDDAMAVASPETLIASSVQDPAHIIQDSNDDDGNVDMAALLAQARAAPAEEDGDDGTEDEAEEAMTTAVPTEPTAEADVQDSAANDHASDAETASTASEDAGNDWDFVRASGDPALPPYDEADDEDDEDEMEISFSRWPAHVRAIREIMPRLSLVVCTDALDKHNGDLEAALIELTEM